MQMIKTKLLRILSHCEIWVEGKKRNRVSGESGVAFVLWHRLCCVGGCFKQSDTAPEQVGMLRVGKLVGDKGDFFSQGTESVALCFFIPALDQQHSLCARRGIILSDTLVQNVRLGPGLSA